MLLLLVVEAALAALTTWLIIKAGRDVANEEFLIADFVWIVMAQSTAYIVGAVSWVFAERAGFGAFGRYMMRFARDNKRFASLLGDKSARETAEPFLTNETFHIFFELMYELEADLKLFFGLIFNSLVLGFAIDAGLPVAYALVFAVLMCLQWWVRKPIAKAYVNNQRQTNRLTAHTYNAWDNIFSGNRYNFRLWHAGFKLRLRNALDAQIRAIMAREGLSTVSGIIALGVVFGYIVVIAARDVGDMALLIGLAATLPRQIELSHDVHGLVTGWNDLLAVWVRIGGACNTMHPEPDIEFNERIRFDRLSLTLQLPSGGVTLPCGTLQEMQALVKQQRSGRILVRGSNGSGKSTLLAALKTQIGSQAFYWPTTDGLTFAFTKQAENSQKADSELEEIGEMDDPEEAGSAAKDGFSSGERQLKSLQEIVENTQAEVYLLDEWDANLDPQNRVQAENWVQNLAARALVVEISHRDQI
jgi:ABC-type multidrug transport system fused ATPase/permease subunit